MASAEGPFLYLQMTIFGDSSFIRRFSSPNRFTERSEVEERIILPEESGGF